MNRPGPTTTTNWLAVLVFFAAGCAAAFAQATVGVVRDWTGAQVDLLPGMVVYAALAFPLAPALGCAAAFGLLHDSLSANPLGVSLLALSLVALAISRQRETFLADQSAAHWTLGAAASAGAPLAAVAVLWMWGAAPLLGPGSLWQWAVMTAGGAAATPVWFKIFNWLDGALRYKELPEAAFRADRQMARGRH